jgi:hypothetical protein
MKIRIFLAFIFLLLSGIAPVKSQDLLFRKEVDKIDSILSKNPYNENFLGITYYYSFDISNDRELIITMAFDGPFTTVFKAALNDLNIDSVVDTTEYSSSMCWQCREGESGKIKTCVRQTNTYTSGEKDFVDSEDICIMLPVQQNIRVELIKAINDVVRKARE